MENKKNKKKLFAIIGASALAFILTVALSVSITLAYFGDKTNGSATVTMGEALTFAAGTTASTTLEKAKTLPGASSTIKVDAKIAQTTTTAYLRAKVVADGTGKTSIVLGDSFTIAEGKLTKSGDYWYLTDAAGTNMVVLDATAGDKAISFTIPYSVDPTLTNDVADQEITVTVTLEIVQSEYIATDATLAKVAAAWDTATVD